SVSTHSAFSVQLIKKTSQLCRHNSSGVDTAHASSKSVKEEVASGVDTVYLCVHTHCPSQELNMKPVTNGTRGWFWLRAFERESLCPQIPRDFMDPWDYKCPLSTHIWWHTRISSSNSKKLQAISEEDFILENCI
ncbi:hypothetical protein Taro_004595, partial [Colocasia esculenta]|nr:hypothetical protein [Colocasia esculenta]